MLNSSGVVKRGVGWVACFTSMLSHVSAAGG